MPTYENERRELNETEKAAQKEIRMRVRPFLKIWLKQDLESIERYNFDAMRAKKLNATPIPQLINILKNQLTLKKWPAVEGITSRTAVYVPKTDKMPEPQTIPIPEAPEKFLDLLTYYESTGEIPEWAHKQVPIQQEEADEELDDVKGKLRGMIHAFRGVKDLKKLFSLTQINEESDLSENEKDKLRRRLFINMEGDWIFDETIDIDGRETNMKDEIETRALQLIYEEVGRIRDLETFEQFREEVSRFKFYNVPTRTRANDILKHGFRRIVDEAIESAPSKSALDTILSSAGQAVYEIRGSAAYLTHEELADIRAMAKRRKKDLFGGHKEDEPRTTLDK